MVSYEFFFLFLMISQQHISTCMYKGYPVLVKHLESEQKIRRQEENNMTSKISVCIHDITVYMYGPR